MDNPHNLPTDDILDMTEAKCPPPEHAEKCRRMAQEMANAERLLYRLADGDKDAAIRLLGLSEHRPYDGKTLAWQIDKLLANVIG